MGTDWLYDDRELLLQALKFYVDPANWEAVEIERISDVLSSRESGPAIDGGARARAALTANDPEWAAECAEFGCHQQDLDQP